MNDERLTDEQCQLIEDNIRLVHHIVKRYSDTRVRKDEFTSAGYFGLVKAAKTFNPQKGTKFTTYAGTCISNSILDLLADVGRKHGRYASLDDTVWHPKNGKGNASTLADLHDDGIRIEDDVLQRSELEERRLIIGLYLLNKPPRHAQIIKLRLQNEMTNEQIAKEIGISKSYVSRILTRIEKELSAFKRKIDLTDGQYIKRYTASDIAKARQVLKDPSEWIIQIERCSAAKKSVHAINPSVNFLHKGLCFNSDLVKMIDPDSEQVDIMFSKTGETEGTLVFKFREGDASYFMRIDDSSARIESAKLTSWLFANGITPKKYTTCYFDDTERTLYVKVECIPNAT